MSTKHLICCSIPLKFTLLESYGAGHDVWSDKTKTNHNKTSQNVLWILKIKSTLYFIQLLRMAVATVFVVKSQYFVKPPAKHILFPVGLISNFLHLSDNISIALKFWEFLLFPRALVFSNLFTLNYFLTPVIKAASFHMLKESLKS